MAKRKITREKILVMDAGLTFSLSQDKPDKSTCDVEFDFAAIASRY
jgi:hypothetical protein